MKCRSKHIITNRPQVNTWVAVFVLFFIGTAVVHAGDAISTADRSVVRIFVARGGGEGASGTGFAVDDSGTVVTNAHVVDQNLKIVVAIKRDRRIVVLPATVIWASSGQDLALLRVQGLALPALTLAESVPVKGSQVMAIGYPGDADRLDDNLNELDQDKGNWVESTITQGIIGRVMSASWSKDGQRQTIVQHSAAINHGSSGGPLLDLCGRVIGVNTQLSTGTLVKTAQGYAVSQVDGIFYASHIGVLTDTLRAHGVQVVVATEGCGASGVSALATQSSDYWPAALIGTLILAVASLVIAMKKSVILKETFTQYLRRSVPTPAKSTDTIANIWTLQGKDNLGRAVDLIIDQRLSDKGQIIIGRDPLHCQLAIDDQSVSRQHACLSFSSGRLQLVDLSSSNGTWVNDDRISSRPITLRRGQIVKLGDILLQVDRRPV